MNCLKKNVYVSEAEYKILKKFINGAYIEENDNTFLIEKLATVGLIKLGMDFDEWRATAKTTKLGREMIGL